MEKTIRIRRSAGSQLIKEGMKMSKSLKNFVTVRELLTEGAVDSVLSSPADDFRLWCLGLSGSYKAPATYSKDRIDKA
jgi:cysteinyl-tRNA synthetase